VSFVGLRGWSGIEEFGALEGEYAVVHDQMIEHGDLDEGEGGSDPVRDLEVCVRRLRVSGRMIVIEHHADGVMVKDRSHHFAGVHAAPVEGAAKEVGMAISRCAVLRCRRPSARRGLSHTAAAYIRTSPVMRKPDLLSMTGGGMAAGGNRASSQSQRVTRCKRRSPNRRHMPRVGEYLRIAYQHEGQWLAKSYASESQRHALQQPHCNRRTPQTRVLGTERRASI